MFKSYPKQTDSKVEGSLDSLDFFKVTNLGRLQNEQSNKKEDVKRKGWSRKKQPPQAQERLEMVGKGVAKTGQTTTQSNNS